MPSRSLKRRRFEAASDGHPGTCARVAAFNGCNAALGQTGILGHKLLVAERKCSHSTAKVNRQP